MQHANYWFVQVLKEQADMKSFKENILEFQELQKLSAIFFAWNQ